MKPAFHRLCVFGALILPLTVRAQFPPAGTRPTRSSSGQFIVTTDATAPSRPSPRAITANPNLVRLEPALLAVSAERTRESLWRALGINFNTPWRGQIYLTLHPAQRADEDAVILSSPLAAGWNYQVRLPDAISREHFTRALTGVLLLEYASRHSAPGQPVEIPAWLVDGITLQLLAAGGRATLVPAPDKIVNGLTVNRTLSNERGLDPLAAARQVLRNHPALAFEQLSWPTRAQLAGADDGVYRASAQVFVDELLKLKNGRAKLRTLLEILPQSYNWQTAFQAAFRDNFPNPLAVEKWWALQLVSFAARDPGPAWTPAVSRAKLDEILRVPVEVRASSNALPAHVDISLQAILRNWDTAQQSVTLTAKLRELDLAQLRMATPLSALTADYRRVLADYLGERKTLPLKVIINKSATARPAARPAGTVKKLDALDLRRLKIEADIKPDNLKP